jgi:hypothetical protein
MLLVVHHGSVCFFQKSVVVKICGCFWDDRSVFVFLFFFAVCGSVWEVVFLLWVLGVSMQEATPHDTYSMPLLAGSKQFADGLEQPGIAIIIVIIPLSDTTSS